MKAFFIFLFSLLASVVSMAQNVKFDIEADLHRLDTVVANSHKYDAQKMHDINYIKRSTGDFVTPTERYNFYKRLYDEYMKFDSDSAKHYASMCQKVASRTNMHNYEVAAILDRAYIFITCGELIDAQRILNTISTPIDSLPDDVRMKYAITMLEYRIRLDLKSFWENKYGDKEACLAVWNKYNRYLPDDMWQKHYYESSLTDHDVLKKLQADLANTQRPSIKAAMLYVSIARQYKKRGADEKLYLHYLILSAINDVKSSNREASSLIFIVNSPHICAGTERAFNYAMLCTENAKSYKDVGRSFDIVKAHAKITRAYQKRLEYNIMLCIGCMALLVLAILAVVLLYRNVVRKRRAQAELLSQIETANVSLEESVKKEQQALEKLRHSNALLRDEIAYHNSNFINVYQLVTKYIADVQAFKKSVFNLITSGKIDKARSELKSQTNAENYLQNFFVHFDKAFLASHPDFVERFNQLLKPECAIVPPTDDRLTPELRIYALVSMGITDSVSIAEFLHYSPQTIYNYRLRVRHCACIPEKNFADAVAQMYADE
ncbi:DUF6377 domain-containing protein [uncultured Prevotella sp.]|uniref:DUF6377 domain-containing protein n=1 Tax=uncultured Prevotella sp. TaxID=159272 RepID=UPI0027E335F2|nr:DUF6377 domain-containing protein [uncultured Prevotella sp.]